MELRPQFDAFLRDIRPSERNKEEWKRSSNTLRARLLADPILSPLNHHDLSSGKRSSFDSGTPGRRQALRR